MRFGLIVRAGEKKGKEDGKMSGLQRREKRQVLLQRLPDRFRLPATDL